MITKMKKVLFLCTIIIMTISCDNKKSTNTPIIINDESAKIDFILDSNLSQTDYSDYEGYFPEKGLVPTAEIAVKIAEPVLKYIYGSEKIEKQKPFSVNLDNNIWIIEGFWDKEKDMFGGVAYMEIRKSNGEILKVIHGK